MATKDIIYAIGPANGPIKIGITDNPLSRMQSMQSNNHQRLCLIWHIRVDPELAVLAERLVHHNLTPFRVISDIRHEWYKLGPEEAKRNIQEAIEKAKLGAAVSSFRNKKAPNGRGANNIRGTDEVSIRLVRACASMNIGIMEVGPAVGLPRNRFQDFVTNGRPWNVKNEGERIRYAELLKLNPDELIRGYARPFNEGNDRPEQETRLNP